MKYSSNLDKMIRNLKWFKLIFLIVTIIPALNGFGPISSEITMILSKQAENIYEKVILSKPSKNLFENKEEKKNVSTNLAKEHGQLDFFGRDLVRDIGKTINNVENKIFLATSKGLDVNNTFLNVIMGEFKNKMKIIFPGTLWCGNGNKAESNAALGLFYLTDSCCREHDKCNASISAGETRNGLLNTGLFSRSACSCDIKFHNCLKNADSIIAHKIGITYFTVLGPQCFKNDYPIIKCNKMNTGRCIDYELDLTKDKYDQWFDNPIY